jgi:hypothetical protein
MNETTFHAVRLARISLPVLRTIRHCVIVEILHLLLGPTDLARLGAVVTWTKETKVSQHQSSQPFASTTTISSTLFIH